jgi:hypothetical protein
LSVVEGTIGKENKHISICWIFLENIVCQPRDILARFSCLVLCPFVIIFHTMMTVFVRLHFLYLLFVKYHLCVQLKFNM